MVSAGTGFPSNLRSATRACGIPSWQSGGGFKPISRNAVEEEAVASEKLSKTAVVEESRWILPAVAEIR
ncbi:MAG: hypothetical protein J6J65_08465 [Opitutales bacterium]|nr:hypothetical protein [Opitutales bacterium]